MCCQEEDGGLRMEKVWCWAVAWGLGQSWEVRVWCVEDEDGHDCCGMERCCLVWLVGRWKKVRAQIGGDLG